MLDAQIFVSKREAYQISTFGGEKEEQFLQCARCRSWEMTSSDLVSMTAAIKCYFHQLWMYVPTVSCQIAWDWECQVFQFALCIRCLNENWWCDERQAGWDGWAWAGGGICTALCGMPYWFYKIRSFFLKAEHISVLAVLWTWGMLKHINKSEKRLFKNNKDLKIRSLAADRIHWCPRVRERPVCEGVRCAHKAQWELKAQTTASALKQRALRRTLFLCAAL